MSPSFYLDGNPETLPIDWVPPFYFITKPDGSYSIYIKRQGRMLPLTEAIITRDLLSTSSRAANKRPVKTDDIGC